MMDVSLLSFTPKVTELKKDDGLKTVASKLVFQSPRRRRNQTAFPLRDICGFPSNLQNIEKNRKSTSRNSTIRLNDSLYSPCGNTSKVKFGREETVVLESSDAESSTCSFRKSNCTKPKVIDTIVIESSDSEGFVSDSIESVCPKFTKLPGKSFTRAVKSTEDGKEKVKEIENFLDELQEFIYERRTPGSSLVSISHSSTGTDADEVEKMPNNTRMGKGKTNEECINTKSNISSVQGLEQRRKISTKQVKESRPVNESVSSSQHFKKTPKQINDLVEKRKSGAVTNVLRASHNKVEETGEMDNDKFENIVQWLGKLETPLLNTESVCTVGKESDNENSLVHSVRRPGYRHNVIISDSESENSSGKSSESRSIKRRSDSKSDSDDESSGGSLEKKQLLSRDEDSNFNESLVILTKKKNQLKIYDNESSSDENERGGGLILSPTYSVWRKKDGEGGSECSSSNKKSDENDSSSERSGVSATSMDRLLSNIYGDTWDKETVLTPVVKKIQSGKQKKIVRRALTDNRVKDPLTTKGKRKVPVGKALTPSFHLNPKQLDFSEQENIPTPPGQVLKPFKFPKPPKTPKTPKKILQTPVSRITSPQPTITFGFLRSLSVSPPSTHCNVKALYYKKDFKNKKEALSAELFTYYNKMVFDNKLPSDMKVEWNARLNRTAGYCYNSSVLRSGGKVRVSRIELATKVCTTPDRVRDTLIHEMCHAAVWVLDGVKGGHGPSWKAWARKATKKLPELPPIGRCHQYKIETKFTYRCKTCGYSIGRHSKSLDLARKRCGWCYGEFELLVNVKSRKADAPAAVTPRTPRVATGFALYVKENYKTVREQKKDLKHAEIMKLLGTKFAELKMQTNI